MKRSTVTITRRTRILGFASDTSPPTSPSIVGTPGIVIPHVEAQRSHTKARLREQWFYGVHPIIADPQLETLLTALATGRVNLVTVHIKGDAFERPVQPSKKGDVEVTIHLPAAIVALCTAQPEGRSAFVRHAIDQALRTRGLRGL